MASASESARPAGRVLLTGADGFTGRHLAPLLAAAGHEVHGLVQRAPGPGDAPIPGVHKLHAANLLDAAALAEVVREVRPQAVAHLAAISFVAHGDPEAIYRTNIVGTRHLLAALAGGPAPEVVRRASSANVYGNTERDRLDEAVPPAPANDYAVSKLAMEHMAALWADRLPIVVVRPFNYTGVGQSRNFLLPKIVEHFRARAPHIELGNLDVERDFSDVRDVVATYARLLGRPDLRGRCFNVCSGEGHTLRQVLALCETLTGLAMEVRVNPAFVRANEVRRLVGDGRALAQALGGGTRIGLRDTLAWMLA